MKLYLLMALVALAITASFRADAEQRRFNSPRINGALVDRCSPWGENCDRGGADAFCQRQGYDRASAWAIASPWRTWVLGSERSCEGRDCQGLTYVDCERVGGNYPGSGSGTDRFQFPRVNGLPVDRCATWGESCGQGGADLFCTSKGFARALSFTTYRPGRTWVIGSNRNCEGGDCEALRSVTCVGDAGYATQLPGYTPVPPFGQTRRFDRPRINGAQADACATWGERCNRGGADLFCQRQGYGRASNWQNMPANRTFVIGSNRYCTSSCTALRFVDCIGNR